MAKTRPKPKPRRRREPLNPEKIAVAALEFIDAHGLEELSTRRLGAELQVEGMALYKHYPSKDALLDAVAERLILTLEVPASGTWQERLRSFCTDYRNLAWKHPRAFPLLAQRRFNTPRTLQLLDSLFAPLLQAGFAPKLAVELYRVANNFCTGTALDELAGLEHQRRTRGKGQQPPEGLPNLSAVAPWLGPDHFDPLFQAGLAVIVEGFERRLSA